jgi:hypothetical protein
VAARIVMSQMEGSGRGDLASSNSEHMRTLRRFLHDVPMKDCSDWLAQLTQENEMLGGWVQGWVGAGVGEGWAWRCCAAVTDAPMLGPSAAGVRIMEVRAAYADDDFEWGNLERLAKEGLAAENVRLLRAHASKRFTAMLEQAGEGPQ